MVDFANARFIQRPYCGYLMKQQTKKNLSLVSTDRPANRKKHVRCVRLRGAEASKEKERNKLETLGSELP